MIKRIRELIGQGFIEVGLRMCSPEKLQEISMAKLAKAVKMISENPAPGEIHTPQLKTDGRDDSCWFDWQQAIDDGFTQNEITDYLTGVTFTPELDDYILDPGDRSAVH